MFRPLPTSFEALEKAISQLDMPLVEPPPLDTRAVGERLRERYVQARGAGLQTLVQADWRRLPYAYWLPGQEVLPRLEPDLVRSYWSEQLPGGLERGGRPAQRWLSVLFFVYCQEFKTDDEIFAGFAAEMRHALDVAADPFAMRLKRLHAQCAFLDPERVARRLATDCAGSGLPLDGWLQQRTLWAEFPCTELGAQVLTALLAGSSEELRQAGRIEAVLAWMSRRGVAPHKSPWRVRFAEALLLPWHGRNPPEELRHRLVTLFTAADSYGDPRVLGARAFQWEGVSSDAVAVLKRWLVGDTLRSFLRVLRDTADEIWQYRQKFWMAYYDAGHIEEAWLALGSEAEWQMRRLAGNTGPRNHANLRRAQSNQSVLILKLGHLVFTEWSHSGSLRALEDGDPQAPILYRNEYDAFELRDVQSLDFHDGMNLNPELRHHGSVSGHWQVKTRDFIRKHTGVYMDIRKLIL